METEIEKQENQEATNVELYNREISDMLGDAPEWLIHTGSYFLYGIIIVLLIGTALFKYPDVVQGTVIIDDQANIEWVTANSSGLIDRFFVKDRSQVHRNDTLGVIKNEASIDDVKFFCGVLTSVEWYYRTDDVKYLYDYPFDLIMGEMSDAYEQFTLAVRNCLIYRELDVYPHKKNYSERVGCSAKRFA